MKILKDLFKDKKMEIELKEIKEKYEFLKIEFAKLSKFKDYLENELKQYENLKGKIEAKDKKIKDLRQENENQKEELIKYKVSEKELEDKKVILENKVFEKEIIESKYVELKENFKDLKRRSEEENEEKKRVQKELSKSLQNIDELNKELNNSKNEKEKEKQKREKLDKELNSLNEENKNLKNELLKKEEILLKEINKSEKKTEDKRKIETMYEQLVLKIEKLKKENNQLNLKFFNQETLEKEKTEVETTEKLNTCKCLDYNEYLQNKDKLNEYLSTFSVSDFRKIHSLAKKKNIFNTFEERQILNVITWLKFNTPLEKLNVNRIRELYIKFMEKFHEELQSNNEIVPKVEQEIKEIQKMLPKVKEVEDKLLLDEEWSSYDNYLKNKNDLISLLKTFKEIDFKEIFLESKKRGIIKPSQEREFSNILTRLKLKLPITDVSLEKIEPFYEKLIKEIHKNNIENIDDLERIETKEKESNEEVNDDEVLFEIEKYTAEDWYRLYELSKNNKNISEWLRKYIFTLSKYIQNNLEITRNQYQVIKNNYADLYPLIKKNYNNKIILKDEIYKQNTNSNMEVKEIADDSLKIKLDKNIADILF